ncbi:hypothetical protein DFH07DRAFT_697192, partial [Mycena maculata]
DPVASSESTIVDLMSHRTRLPHHAFIDFPDSVLYYIHCFWYLRPSAGFHELLQYDNHMYNLMSFFPPLLVRMPFEKYVASFILEPLGMR